MSAVPQATGSTVNTRRARSVGRPFGETTTDTTSALVTAALETFAEVGYDAASTRTILERAGVSAPVLYHHFGNKAGLFAAVMRHVNTIVVDALRSASTEGDLPTRLRSAFQASADLQARNRPLVRFLATAPLELRFHPELREAAPDMRSVIGFFNKLCQDHAGPGVDADNAARVARVHLHGLTRVAATASAAEFRRTVDALASTLDGPPFRPAASVAPVASNRRR